MLRRTVGAAVAGLMLLMTAIVYPQSPPVQPDAPFRASEILVRFTDQPSPGDVQLRLAQYGMSIAKTLNIVDGLYLVYLPDGQSVAEGQAAAATLTGVAYAEPNYLLHTTATPNDPSLGELWGLHNTGQSSGVADADIDAAEAWDITTGSSSVVVAVIDTGIDYNHPDLAANMFQNTADCNSDGVDNDGNGYVDDCYGIDTANNDSNPMDDNSHGTHVAGTIGARGNNGVGVVGVNWNVKLLACKFLSSGGSGSTADAIDCLTYVRVMQLRGVNIVATNNSWGGGGYSQSLYDAINTQKDRGILFVAAAGNNGANNDSTPHYPSNYALPNIISVAATTRTDARSSFSNYGRRSVHIGAPGSAITSTTPNSSYAAYNGTSMATPHVTGVAALLKAADSNRDWRAIKNLILSGGDAISSMSETMSQRRLNAYQALTCSNRTVRSRLQPASNSVAASIGEAVAFSVLHIHCASPNGTITAVVSPGNQSFTLTDDGISPDQASGDGIYSGTFTPTQAVTYTVDFPGGDTVSIGIANSTYDSGIKAPRCSALAVSCDSGVALVGRGLISGGVEPNRPNTVNNSCQDGNSGYFHSDESLDRLRIRTLDNGLMIAGKAVTVEATVYAYSSSSNVLDLYYSANASSPSWQHIASIVAGGTGVRTLTASYMLPAGTQQAIRGRFRYLGSPSPCYAGSYDDHDDLVFAVAANRNFTDDPLVAETNVIKAVHITELRSRVNTQRARFGLGAFSWTDASLTGVMAKGIHVTQLRTALQQAYTAAGRAAPSFTDGTITTGVLMIKATHINDLRAAVFALEGS